ncbi:MAG: GtrA family protein [Bryobacteraceae bacterium]
MLRWMRFNAVSAAGVCVQLSLLWLLMRLNGGNHLEATLLAVEAAVLHNFYWHWRWTWADRARGPVIWALARFQLTNGLIPVIGNLAGMYWLVDRAGLPPLPANVISICACYLVNYFAADWFVFPRLRTFTPPRAAESLR